MNPKEIFETNLKHMSRFSERYISEIQSIDYSSYEFCQTELSEINLKTKIDGNLFFFHSQKGALEESQQSLQEIPNLSKIETIFIYGLGLGYFYEASKKWLQGNKNRVLIFLEDDLALIHRFLELPLATEILTNPQVVVQAFKIHKEASTTYIPPEFEWMCTTFTSTKKVITALKTYQEGLEKKTLLIRMMLHLRFSYIETGLGEDYERRIKELFTNLYYNLRSLPDAYRGQNLKDKFSEIPTLICGAGSSLSKIATQIRELKDKILIFGAGTGMNVLNKLGTIPHFGGAIDPNEESINRIKTNYAFEVPFFYMNRFEHHALQGIHGPRLFLRTKSPTSVEDWFEIELGITDSIAIDAMVSTTNYLLHVAQILGCNPMVLAGVDLAYTDKSRYPKEIQAHPLDSPLQDELIKSFPIASRNLIPMKNAAGEEIFSRYDWLQEGESYSHFAKQFPNHELLNVTQGGLPISDIPNPSLKDVAETYLQKEYDFHNFIHAAIQSAGKVPVSKEKLYITYEKWKKSLNECSILCSKILAVFESQRVNLIETGEVPEKFLTDEISKILERMGEQPAFQYCLKDMSKVHKKITLRGMHLYNWFPELFSKKEHFFKILEFEETKIELFKHVAELHVNIIDTVLQDVEVDIPSTTPFERKPSEHYSIQEGRLIISDSEMELNINEPFDADKKIHGPSRYFSDTGTLLAEGWFYHGKRIGKNWQYYASGKLYSLQRFKEGDWHGTQEYFFENGHRKSIINYSQGLLDGKVELFHENGTLARELNFSKGKLHGYEKDWNTKGQQLSESQYNMNTPVGVARKWHPNGNLRTEKVYHDSVEHYDLTMWDENGKKMYEYFYIKELGMELLQNSKERRDALDKLKKQLDDIKLKRKED